MKISNKVCFFLEKVYGDDLGVGKSKTSKHRHSHTQNVRLRRFVKSLE